MVAISEDSGRREVVLIKYILNGLMSTSDSFNSIMRGRLIELQPQLLNPLRITALNVFQGILHQRERAWVAMKLKWGLTADPADDGKGMQ